MKVYLEFIIMILIIITGFLIPIAFKDMPLDFKTPVLNYISNKYNA